MQMNQPMNTEINSINEGMYECLDEMLAALSVGFKYSTYSTSTMTDVRRLALTE